ncbi:hypothetical protein GZH53_16860 [Flavihumibacter sp. R14]|nr:hypothetical protein [Flavihumibacter soli]
MAVIFYLIISIYLGRRNPLFYLLFPLALQQGPGAFIDQTVSLGNKKIFSVTDNIFNDVLFFVLLFIAIFFIKVKFPRLNNVGSSLIIIYSFYLLTLFIGDFFSDEDRTEVFLTARDFFYIGVNFILWLSVFHVVTRVQYEDFLRLMFYITPVSAILYVLNSSNILPIFPKEIIYSEVDHESSHFLRDFATIPFFLTTIIVLCIQSLLMPILKVSKYIIFINLICLSGALLFTFTRSIIITVAIQIAVIVILKCCVDGWKGIFYALKFTLVFCACFGPIYLIANKMFPGPMTYFNSRFSSASVEGKNDQNVDIRLRYLDKAIDITNHTNPLIGAGMNRKYYRGMNDVGAWKADSTIPFFLYHTGWLGLMLLYSILLYFSISSVIHFFRTRDWLVAYLASFFISTTISSLIMGGPLYGSMWSFINFALYITIRAKFWKRPTLILVRNEFPLKIMVQSGK